MDRRIGVGIVLLFATAFGACDSTKEPKRVVVTDDAGPGDTNDSGSLGSGGAGGHGGSSSGGAAGNGGGGASGAASGGASNDSGTGGNANDSGTDGGSVVQSDASVDGGGPDGSTSLTCGPGAHYWSQSFGQNGTLGLRVALDLQGNAFFVGHYNGTLDFSSAGTPASCKLTAVTDLDAAGGEQDGFLVKLDPCGKCLWARSFGGHGNQETYRVDVDQSTGDAVIAGEFSSSIDFGGGKVIASGGGKDVFVARINGGSGATVWARGFGDSADQIAYGLGAGGGSVWVAGDVQGTIDFGKTPTGPAVHPLTSNGGWDVFVAALDFYSGDEVWSHSYGDTSDQNVRALTNSQAGGVLVAGSFTGTLDFSGGPKALVSGGGATVSNGFAVLFDVDGNHVWSRGIGGTEAARSESIANDSGLTYVYGGASGQTDYGAGYKLGTAGTSAAYTLSLYTSDGTTSWAQIMTSTGGVTPGAVAVDPTNHHVYTTGVFQGTSDYLGTQMTNLGGTTWFLLEASDANGGPLNHRQAVPSPTAFNIGLGLAVSSDAVFACGYYTVGIDFQDGPGNAANPLTSPSGIASYLTKLGKQ